MLHKKEPGRSIGLPGFFALVHSACAGSGAVLTPGAALLFAIAANGLHGVLMRNTLMERLRPQAA